MIKPVGEIETKSTIGLGQYVCTMTYSVTLEPMGVPIQANKIDDQKCWKKHREGSDIPRFGRLPMISGEIVQLPLGAG